VELKRWSRGEEGELEALNNLTSRGIYYIMKSIADKLQKNI